MKAELNLRSAWLIRIKLLDKIGQDILKYSIQYKGMNRCKVVLINSQNLFQNPSFLQICYLW